MSLSALFSHDILVWVVLPILIFVGGLSYVSLGTLRIIFVARGQRFLSPLLGFFEVSVWLIAISQIMNSVSNIGAYIAYAGGFAVGNYVGILIEEKMAIGILVVRIILTKNDEILKNGLAAAGFGVTSVDAEGIHSRVKLIFTVVRRKDLDKVVRIINESHSSAFYSVEDARSVTEGVFPQKK
ncbi:MAG TPA: DUF2179 domain-containing protein [Syntrophomonadaceae bacterium]|nr:DUF2179 domain-containing protein [Syntrophomonadaceae bacterium]